MSGGKQHDEIEYDSEEVEGGGGAEREEGGNRYDMKSRVSTSYLRHALKKPKYVLRGGYDVEGRYVIERVNVAEWAAVSPRVKVTVSRGRAKQRRSGGGRGEGSDSEREGGYASGSGEDGSGGGEGVFAQHSHTSAATRQLAMEERADRYPSLSRQDYAYELLAHVWNLHDHPHSHPHSHAYAYANGGEREGMHGGGGGGEDGESGGDEEEEEEEYSSDDEREEGEGGVRLSTVGAKIQLGDIRHARMLESERVREDAVRRRASKEAGGILPPIPPRPPAEGNEGGKVAPRKRQYVRRKQEEVDRAAQQALAEVDGWLPRPWSSRRPSVDRPSEYL
uniref:Uncharacterized protein n=1 Tax=Palpitomonas bilix TaxID=652834 RepID=A0A7S3D6C2_9EUKA